MVLAAIDHTWIDYVTGIATALIAIFTLTLFGATALLAWYTSKLVSKTRDLAIVASKDAASAREDARQQRLAQERPLLVDVVPGPEVREDPALTIGRNTGPYARLTPPEHEHVELQRLGTIWADTYGDKIWLSLPLRNVGRGLAVCLGARLASDGPSGYIQRRNVPPNEIVRFGFFMTPHDLSLGIDEVARAQKMVERLNAALVEGSIDATAWYTDYARQEYWSVSVKLTRLENAWEAISVETSQHEQREGPIDQGVPWISR